MVDASSGAPDIQFARPRARELWLQSEGLSQKERLDRLAGDYDLYLAIKASTFVGDDWEFVAGEMARYGMAVFEAWMGSGVITERCLEKKVKGVPSLPEAVRRDRHLCEDQRLTNPNERITLVHRDDGFGSGAGVTRIYTDAVRGCLFVDLSVDAGVAAGRAGT